jgi:hypothetical protein
LLYIILKESSQRMMYGFLTCSKMPLGLNVRNLLTERRRLMARHARVTTIAVIAGLMALLLVFNGVVRAQPSDSAEPRESTATTLTAEERAAFVEGAKKVAGLNDAQIAKVLKNPEMIDDIPVSTRFTSRTVEAPSTTVSGGTQQARAAYAPVTRTKLATLNYNDANGKLLFKTEVIKTWVFDGDRVISGSMNDVTTWVREDARYSPEAGGWRYAEDSEAHTERFVAYAGRANGGHKSTFAGRFDFFYPFEAQPAAQIRQGVVQIGHYQGTCDSTAYAPKGAIVVRSGPSGPSQSTTAAFEFSSAEDAGATFKCRLDGAGFAGCSSPKSYASLSQGAHTFRLVGEDSSGNAMIRPPTRAFTVDTVAPTVTSTAPISGATGVAAGSSVAAVFSEDVEALTLIDGFTIVKAGTTTPVDANPGYEPSTRRAVLDPVANLTPGATYTARIKGGTSGIKDRASNPLVADKVWSFTVAE